jgi:hypothetical protein
LKKLKVHEIIWSAMAAQRQNIHLIILRLRVRAQPLMLMSGYVMILKTESKLTHVVSSSAKAEHSPNHPNVKGLSLSTAAGFRIFNDQKN